MWNKPYIGGGTPNEDWFPGCLEHRIGRSPAERKAAYLLGWKAWWDGKELEDCPFSVMDACSGYWLEGYRHILHVAVGDGGDTPSLSDSHGGPANHQGTRDGKPRQRVKRTKFRFGGVQ